MKEEGLVPEPPEIAVPGWWWQVLGADSREPVLGCGRADREPDARILAEAQMRACEGSAGAMITGPGGVLRHCRRAAGGRLRWVPL